MLSEKECLNITDLDVSYQNITEIPRKIRKLTNLEVLNISGNPISCLPDEVASLSKLEWLIMRSTNVEGIPTAMSNLKELSLFAAKPNPNLPSFLNVECNEKKKTQRLMQEARKSFEPLEKACRQAIVTWLCIRQYGETDDIQWKMLDRNVFKKIGRIVFETRCSCSVWGSFLSEYARHKSVW